VAKLNHSITADPTIDAMDDIIYQKKMSEPRRKYLGASQIGDPCWRKLFYSFRAVEFKTVNRKDDPDGFSREMNRIKATEDGHYQELVMIENLRQIPGVEVFNDDGTGNQIGFQLLLGHFNGHIDGVITGLLQAPKTPHVFEAKCRLDKFLDNLEKLKAEKGEKNALREWSDEYYAQAQIYCHTMQLERHYLVCASPGGRRHVSVRTDYCKKDAEAIIEKARSIIFDNWTAPARLSDKREFFSCKWCDYQEICHDGRVPQVNCKTCRYCEPVKDGKFNCSKTGHEISDQIIWHGCVSHLFNPALIQAELIEHQECSVLYKIGKTVFANTELSGMPDLSKPVDAIYTSEMLRNEIKFIGNVKPQDITGNPDVKAMGVNKPAKAWQTNKRGLKV
jgi:hypothetical protein